MLRARKNSCSYLKLLSSSTRCPKMNTAGASPKRGNSKLVAGKAEAKDPSIFRARLAATVAYRDFKSTLDPLTAYTRLHDPVRRGSSQSYAQITAPSTYDPVMRGLRLRTRNTRLSSGKWIPYAFTYVHRSCSQKTIRGTVPNFASAYRHVRSTLLDDSTRGERIIQSASDNSVAPSRCAHQGDGESWEILGCSNFNFLFLRSAYREIPGNHGFRDSK